MCLAAVAKRKMVTICHLSSSSRHLKKFKEQAGKAAVSQLSPQALEEKKSWPLSSMHMAQYGGKSINTYM